MKGGGKRKKDQDNIFNSRHHMCMSAAYYTRTLRYSPGTQVLKGERPKLPEGRGCVQDSFEACTQPHL